MVAGVARASLCRFITPAPLSVTVRTVSGGCDGERAGSRAKVVVRHWRQQREVTNQGEWCYSARVPPEPTVRALLEQVPGEAICNACLAFACSTSLGEMMQTTGALVASNGAFTSGPGACVSCRRNTTTISFAARGKCAHCSRSLEDDGLGVVIDGDAFHRSCWQVLVSAERIRVSRSLSRRSRELIAEARRRLKR
jgi:hypothetical protein